MDENGEKSLIKFRNKDKSAAESGGTRELYYDNSTLYVNIRGLINTSLEDLRKNSTRNSDYWKLLKKYGQRLPDTFDVGRMLSVELSQQNGLSGPEQVLLDKIGANIEKLLLTGPNDPAKLSEAAGSQVDAAAIARQPQAKPSWDILPADVIEIHNELSPTNPKKFAIAERALKSYLRYAHNSVDAEQLQQLIGSMRQVNDFSITSSCVGAYIDLARNPQTPPSEALQLVDAAAVLIGTLVNKSWKSLQYHEVHPQIYAGILGAYTQKYKKVFASEKWTLDDESQLYLQLLEIARKTLVPARYTDEARGAQFELGIHLLNARSNIRKGQLAGSAWQALPREDKPHDFNFKLSTAWDMAMSKGTFLNQGADCRYIQCKSVDDGQRYAPHITVLIAKEDFSTQTSGDIAQAMLNEYDAKDTNLRARYRNQANRYEQILFDKIGF